MHAYLLALEIEPVTVNKVYVALPLHCTIMHWFRTNCIPAEVTKAIGSIVQSQAPITLVSGADDMFGKEKDVPINLIQNHEEVRAFHQRLLAALKALGIEDVAPDWSGEGYAPHVTRQRSGRFEEGRTHLVNRLYLAEAMAPDQLQQKKIIDKFFLRGESS